MFFFRKSVSLCAFSVVANLLNCLLHAFTFNEAQLVIYTHMHRMLSHTHTRKCTFSPHYSTSHSVLFNTHWQIHAQLHTHTCFHTHTLLICASLSLNLLPSLPLSTSFRSNVSSLSLSFSMFLSLMFYYSFFYYSVT